MYFGETFTKYIILKYQNVYIYLINSVVQFDIDSENRIKSLLLKIRSILLKIIKSPNAVIISLKS